MPPRRHEQCEIAIKPMLELLNYRTFTVGCAHRDVAMITHNPLDGVCLISLFLDGRTAEVFCDRDGRIRLEDHADDSEG